MTNPNRRVLLTGLAALICSPAIVRASSLMPVKSFKESIFCIMDLGSKLRDENAYTFYAPQSGIYRIIAIVRTAEYTDRRESIHHLEVGDIIEYKNFISKAH